MSIQTKLIKISNNFHKLVWPGKECAIYYSYETLVAFTDLKGNHYVRQNEWGNTTGKHLNLIDGGTKEALATRLNAADFTTIFNSKVTT